ncbi:cation:proton antiporter [Halomarina oriensis]|uniref:Cation:proton antiporter n=1 Tax=Halomarina oriensis TaxID=671145 RepID=A0A6B0GHR1_9EURY|nr:cation:proton antiporter [Halomarina oriensis]
MTPTALSTVFTAIPLQASAQSPNTQFVIAVVLGLLFAIGTFLVLRRDVVRVVWGIAIISQATNMYLVTMGGIAGSVPILAHGATPDPATVSNPLVQALVLTAIVIGFGTTAFALVLTYRVYEEHGTIDLAELGAAPPESGVSAMTDSSIDGPEATGDGEPVTDDDGDTDRHGGPAGSTEVADD